MKVVRYPKHNEWQDLLKRPVFDNASLFDTVNTVLKDVKLKGDIAVKEYGLKFDKVLDWYKYQLEYIKNYNVSNNDIFIDEEVELYRSEYNKR